MCFSHYVSGALSYIFTSASLNLMCLVARSCLTLYDPMDYSIQTLLSVGILQVFFKYFQRIIFLRNIIILILQVRKLKCRYVFFFNYRRSYPLKVIKLELDSVSLTPKFMHNHCAITDKLDGINLSCI